MAEFQSVYLGYKNLTGAGVLENLSKNPNNRPDSLLLHSNCIDDQGIEMILRSPKISRVYYLDLYRNQVGDRGALAVILSSKTNNLSSLTLSHNRVSSSGITALAEELPGSNIVCLDLRFNPGSKCPIAFEALISAVRRHKILQYLLTDFASCKTELLPVLKINRDYATQIQKELREVVALLKDEDKLHYPMDALDLNTLKKCEQFFNNNMLFGRVYGTDKLTLIKIQNYINDNYFKITGTVHSKLSAAQTHSSSLAVLPPEVIGKITKYCKIIDLNIL